jgi:hypothetical protein
MEASAKSTGSKSESESESESGSGSGSGSDSDSESKKGDDTQKGDEKQMNKNNYVDMEAEQSDFPDNDEDDDEAEVNAEDIQFLDNSEEGGREAASDKYVLAEWIPWLVSPLDKWLNDEANNIHAARAILELLSRVLRCCDFRQDVQRCTAGSMSSYLLALAGGGAVRTMKSWREDTPNSSLTFSIPKLTRILFVHNLLKSLLLIMEDTIFFHSTMKSYCVSEDDGKGLEMWLPGLLLTILRTMEWFGFGTTGHDMKTKSGIDIRAMCGPVYTAFVSECDDGDCEAMRGLKPRPNELPNMSSGKDGKIRRSNDSSAPIGGGGGASLASLSSSSSSSSSSSLSSSSSSSSSSHAKGQGGTHKYESDDDGVTTEEEEEEKEEKVDDDGDAIKEEKEDEAKVGTRISGKDEADAGRDLDPIDDEAVFEDEEDDID